MSAKTSGLQETRSGAGPRVLFVSPVGEIGGGERVLLSLVEHLPAHGVTCALAAMRPGPLVDAARHLGVSAHEFVPHRYRDVVQVWHAIGWLANLAVRERADVLHSNLTAHLYGGVAARRAGLPEIWHLHDYPHHIDIVHSVATLIPTTHAIFTTQRVASGYPRLAGRGCSIIPPTCINPPPDDAPAAGSGARARLGLPNGPLLLTVARLQAHKGHRTLLDALSLLLKRRDDVVAAIVGEAPEDPASRDYAAEVRARAAAPPLVGRVHCLGRVSDEDLDSLYREATLLVHPALTEGFGLTLIEAMFRRLPVLAADADGPAEIIVHGENGLLTPKGDAAALAGAIEAALGDATLRARLAAGAARYASTHRPQDMAAAMAKVYHRVLKTPAAPRR